MNDPTFRVQMPQKDTTHAAPVIEIVQDYEGRETRFMKALLTTPEAFHQYLVRRVALQLEQTSWEEWHEMLLGELVGDEELLAPVIKTLSAEDQAYYAPSAEEFFDRTEAIRTQFTVQLEQASVQVRTQGEDDLPEQEGGLGRHTWMVE